MRTQATRAERSGVSRRRFLKTGAGSAMAATLATSVASKALAHPLGYQPNVQVDDILFLVNKLTTGFTLEEYRLAQDLGYEGYLEYHLDPQAIDDSDLDAILTQFPTLDMDYDQLYRDYGRDQQDRLIPFRELKFARMYRSIYSKRQLFERMVEFWSDHFNIAHAEVPLFWFKTVDDREVIRQHAMGNFRDLLSASARSGAMLWYLDNYLNTKEAPNENYGRELLELHTLGVDGGYEEFDVKNVSRCFTGWTTKTPRERGFGEFVFDMDTHDTDQKVVLGNIIPPGGGEIDGDMVIDILVTHPSTADYLSRKMCRWLLSYDPPESLVQSVAQIYLATDGDIKSMIRGIFDSGRLKTTNPNANLKFKRPYDYAVSVLRAVDADVSGMRGLQEELQLMGQIPFGWPTPDGYPDSVDAWGTNILPRWSFAARALSGGIRQVDVDLDRILQSLGMLSSRFANAINLLLMGGAMSEEEEDRVQRFVDSQPSLTDNVARQAIGLAAASPSFQYY